MNRGLRTVGFRFKPDKYLPNDAISNRSHYKRAQGRKSHCSHRRGVKFVNLSEGKRFTAKNENLKRNRIQKH